MRKWRSCVLRSYFSKYILLVTISNTFLYTFPTLGDICVALACDVYLPSNAVILYRFFLKKLSSDVVNLLLGYHSCEKNTAEQKINNIGLSRHTLLHTNRTVSFYICSSSRDSFSFLNFFFTTNSNKFYPQY